jgi:hypothetical protein
MANDPYGYANDGVEGVSLVRALWYSIGACMCAATGFCACYIPFFIGAPLGLYGAWQANKALSAARDERDRNMATATIAAGLSGGLVSAMFAGIILLYVVFGVLYLAVIFLAIALGTTGQGF